jgi:hypothetical protein
VKEARVWQGSSELAAVLVGPGTIVEIYSSPVSIYAPDCSVPVMTNLIRWQFFNDGRAVANAIAQDRSAA